MDELLDAFEMECRRGIIPRIEPLLLGLADNELKAYLFELLVLEFYYRRQSGEIIEIDSYQLRFPQYPTVLASAAAEAEKDGAIALPGSIKSLVTIHAEPRFGAPH